MVKILNKLLNDKNITTNKNNSNTLPNILPILYSSRRIPIWILIYYRFIQLSSKWEKYKCIQMNGWHKLYIIIYYTRSMIYIFFIG